MTFSGRFFSFSNRASKYSGYSRDSLRLRIRQSKLKGKKTSSALQSVSKEARAEIYDEGPRSLSKSKLATIALILFLIAFTSLFKVSSQELNPLLEPAEKLLAGAIQKVGSPLEQKFSQPLASLLSFSQDLLLKISSKTSKPAPVAVSFSERPASGQTFALAKGGAVGTEPATPKTDRLSGEAQNLESKTELALIEPSESKEVPPVRPSEPQGALSFVQTDSSALQKLEKQIAEVRAYQGDIAQLQELIKKIQANPTQIQSISSPVYIGSQGVEISGNATLNSLSVSGLTGISELGVGKSASFGADSSNKFTVQATASFLSPVSLSDDLTLSSALTIGTSTAHQLIVDSQGNLTTTGNASVSGTLSVTGSLSTAGDLTVAGLLTVGGLQYASDTVAFLASSTIPALTVNQTGSGSIVAFKGIGNTVFEITRAGVLALTSTSTPQINLAFASTTALTIASDSSGNITQTATGNLTHKFATSSAYTLRQGEVARIAIDTSGNIGLYSSSTITLAGGIISHIGTTTLATTTIAYLENTHGAHFRDIATFDATTTQTGSLIVDTNTLYVDAYHNFVGIGTTGPGYPLEVNGTIKANKIYIPDSTDVQRLMIGSLTPFYSNADIVYVEKSLADQLMVTLRNIYTGVSPAGSQFTVVDDAGNTGGIGISNTSWPGTADGVAAHETFVASFGSSNANLVLLTQHSGTHIRFGINGSEVARITSTGLGIGTTNPQGTLDVNGLIVGGGTSGIKINSSGNVGIGTTSQLQKLDVVGSIRVNNGWFQGSDSATPGSGQVIEMYHTGGLGVIDTSYYSGAYTPLTFKTSGTERVRIDTSGNVGIGTTTPATTLDIYGTTTAQNIIPATDATYYLGSPGRRWNKTYASSSFVGDLVFANDFRITESTTSPSALFFVNPQGEKVAKLDEAGNFTVAGEVKSGLTVLENKQDQIAQNPDITQLKINLASLGLVILDDGTIKMAKIEVEQANIRRGQLEEAQIGKAQINETQLGRLEMVDEKTGVVWCIWLEDGEFAMRQGHCSDPAPRPQESEEPATTQEPAETQQPAVGEEASEDELPSEVEPQSPPAEETSEEPSIEVESVKEELPVEPAPAEKHGEAGQLQP